MAICPVIVHFNTWRARSMHDVDVNLRALEGCTETISANVVNCLLDLGHLFFLHDYEV